MSNMRVFVIVAITLMLMSEVLKAKRFNEVNIPLYREKVKKMFYHAYEGYLKYAYPYDELQPLTCQGFDTWGSYSLTLIDAMDTLVVIGNHSEFRRIANIVIDKGENIFDMDINVSVFETNIRIIGGLLSAHLMMKRTGMQLEPAWPCSGPLLRMAESIARRLLPAFDTPTGMPYGTVNLRFGVPKGETSVTCTAGVGTFIVEFGTLSRLTGDPIFEKTAIRAIRSLWKFRSPLGLLGNHIDVKTGKWTALDSGIGGGVDSYFEYLVKGSILFNLPELVYLFRDYEEPIKKYLKRDDWYMWAHMTKGTITLPMFTSLDAFWPGIQSLLGDIDAAMKTLHNFHQVWHQFGATPEYYNIPKAEVHKGREAYPLRPELIESIMYLYRATKDPVLLEMGVDIVEAIERTARTSCGYATVKDVRDHRLEDRMESFFLAETAKYLYLLFDPDNFIHNNGSHGTKIDTPSGSCIIEAGGYVFNTEAHPIDLASVYCCSAEKQEEERKLEAFHSNLDLLTLTGIVDDISDLGDLDWSMRKRKQIHRKNYEEFEDEEEELDFDEELYEDDDDLDSDMEKEMDKDLSKQEEIKDVEITTEKGNDGIKSADKKANVINQETDQSLSQSFSEEIKESCNQKREIDGEQKDENCFEEGASDNEVEKKKYLPLSKQLDTVDLTGLSDMEKNLAKIFLEQLNLDSDIVDVSLKIGQKMGTDFKGTEIEKVAEFISQQLMQVKKVSKKEMDEFDPDENPDENIQAGDTSEHLDLRALEKTEEIKATDIDEKMEHENDDNDISRSEGNEEDFSEEEHSNRRRKKDAGKESQVENKDTTKNLEDAEEKSKRPEKIMAGTDKKVVILLDGSLPKDSEHEKGGHSQDRKSTNQQSAESKTTHQAPLDPALQRLKDHLEAQLLQQYKLSNLKNDASKEGKLSSLESKRANIISLTTKLFNLFSRGLTGGDADDEENGRNLKPSIAGLYKSLAGYPLKYFHDPHMMHCPAQPFHSRLSVYGEMFEEGR